MRTAELLCLTSLQSASCQCAAFFFCACVRACVRDVQHVSSADIFSLAPPLPLLSAFNQTHGDDEDPVFRVRQK